MTQPDSDNNGDKIEAILVTAILCTVQTSKKRHFRFCIPSGGIVDFRDMEDLAKENGVTEPQWEILLNKIELALESLI